MIEHIIGTNGTDCSIAVVQMYMELERDVVEVAAKEIGYKPEEHGCSILALLQNLKQPKEVVLHAERAIRMLPCIAQVESYRDREKEPHHALILALDKKGNIDILDPNPKNPYGNMAMVMDHLYFTTWIE